MIPVDQLNRFQATNPLYKLVKPWWDVLTEYLVAAMLAVAVLAGALQATQSDLICVPAVPCTYSLNQSLPANATDTRGFCKGNKSTMLLKLPDRRLYDYVATECGRTAVQEFASFFPFIVFLQSIVLIVVQNFWLKLPHTSSTIENFVTLVIECHNTKGTCLAVSDVLWRTKISEKTRSTKISEKTSVRGGTLEFKEDIEQPSNDGKSNENKSSTESLDVSEAIKAKALYEKVGQFRKDVEKKQYIFWIYSLQATLQLGLSIIILVLNAYYHNELKNTVNCTIDYVISKDYSDFVCTNGVIPYFEGINITFCILVALYSIVCIYICTWTYLRRGKEYNFKQNLTPETDHAKQEDTDLFKSLSDIIPAKANLAFMLYLLSYCNKLYTLRFSVFLSKKNEKQIKDHLLICEWPVERLKQLSIDGGETLTLMHLSGIPKTVFKMKDLQGLRLVDCQLGNDLDDKDWGKLKLKSLSLINCRLTTIPTVILKMEYLEKLDLSSNNITCIPAEIESLRSLRTLYVFNNNITHGFNYLIQMEKLMELNLRGNDSLQLTLSPDKTINIVKLEVDEEIMKKMDDVTRNLIKDITVSSEQDIFVIKYLPVHAPPEIESMRKNRSGDAYKMTSNPKGVALIIINDRDSERDRVEKSIEKLFKLFQNIGYHVKEFSLQYDLSKIATLFNKYSHLDSAVLIIMTTNKKLQAKKIAKFMHDSLQGKPKLIFILKNDKFQLHKEDFTSLETECADTAVAYLDHEVSFIDYLVNVFSNHAWEEDVESLLKRVFEFQAIRGVETLSFSCKGLVKKFYFYPGYFPENDQTRNNRHRKETSL